jgi:hypothetical protein
MKTHHLGHAHESNTNVSEEFDGFRVCGLVPQSVRAPFVGCDVDNQGPHARVARTAFVDFAMHRFRGALGDTHPKYDLVHDGIFEGDALDSVAQKPRLSDVVSRIWKLRLNLLFAGPLETGNVYHARVKLHIHTVIDTMPTSATLSSLLL